MSTSEIAAEILRNLAKLEKLFLQIGDLIEIRLYQSVIDLAETDLWDAAYLRRIWPANRLAGQKPCNSPAKLMQLAGQKRCKYAVWSQGKELFTLFQIGG